MTRNEAIKIIDCYDIGFYDLSGEKIPADKLAEAFDMAIDALQTDAVQGWIPCSERLPDEGQGVIVTVDDNVYEIKVGSCIYSNGRFHSLYNDLTVLAWMPLPKPYKGGDSE